MNLVIVESPSKAKTIEKYLGKDYKVRASMGHVIDLPSKELGIDVEKNFEPKYEIIKGKNKIISGLKKDLASADNLIIAVDPDREGEAIGWHIARQLKVINDKGVAKAGKKVQRITFHEITKGAIEEALKHPGTINMDLVDAQQARRLLDRLVGYKLSPLLWRKVRKGLSAGRVQSVAVRLIVEREEARKAFNADEYWSIKSRLSEKDKPSKPEIIFKEIEKNADGKQAETTEVAAVEKKKSLIEFELIKQKNKKSEIPNRKDAEKIVDEVKEEKWVITAMESKEVKKYTTPPFTTSTLQQAASNMFGYPAKRTMQLAQKLYEAGHITYMRTDSTNLAETSIEQARQTIKSEFGNEYVPSQPKLYKTKSKVAQEAHEAIRPTNFNLKSAGATDQEKKLYDLIWRKAIACQMEDARLMSSTIDIDIKDYTFRANGQRILFKAYLAVFPEKVSENILPEGLNTGQELFLNQMLSEQHFTKPPARFTEASLIKELEKNGIGRPSTYAPTISTIQDRGYIGKEGKYLFPQDIAFVVNQLLTDNFSEIVDMKFTAKMEDQLDNVANGEEDWRKLLADFYGPFEKNLKEKEKSIDRSTYTVLGTSEEKCPVCGKEMVVKIGRFGKFLSCVDFPECKGIKNLEPSEGGQASADSESEEFKAKYEDAPTASDGIKMVLKVGRFGSFWAHPDYPKFKEAKPLLLREKCPESGHNMVERKGKWGKTFIACSGYPKCKYIKKDNAKEETE